MLAPGEAQVLNLSVVPDQRRAGLGRALLRRFLDVARERGAEQCFLEVRTTNIAALALSMPARASPPSGAARATIPRRRRCRARMRSCCALAPREPTLTMATRDDMLAELRLAPLWVPRRAGPDAPNMPAHRRTAAPAPAAPMRAAPPGSQDPRALAIATLDFPQLAAHIAGCRACKLCETRQRTVPGVGDEKADWLFVGEAPGAEEDVKGEPFVGQAGRLLDNMLAALDLSRQRNVYIANVLKCRPPNNRTPEPLEAAQCMPYLARQIALLEPKLIVALGRSAAVQLLNVDAPIASLRGRVHRHAGIPLIVTYHPAYLLRNLPDKAKAWEDLVLARRTAREAGSDGAR